MTVKINQSIDFLKRLASQLQKRTLPFVVCYADLHPANVLRDNAGNVFIVDWDEVMMAPKERDFIFLNEASFYGLESNSITSFLKGYGPTEIDWVILTVLQVRKGNPRPNRIH
jgi:Predicted choline kinase involved in LPS biosynthesis